MRWGWIRVWGIIFRCFVEIGDFVGGEGPGCWIGFACPLLSFDFAQDELTSAVLKKLILVTQISAHVVLLALRRRVAVRLILGP